MFDLSVRRYFNPIFPVNELFLELVLLLLYKLAISAIKNGLSSILVLILSNLKANKTVVFVLRVSSSTANIPIEFE